MGKFCISLMIVLIGFSASLGAQALPFTKKVVSQEAYAKAIEKDDRTVLNAPCALIVAAANQVWEGHTFPNCGELASYMRRLIVAPCPHMTTGIARVLGSEKIDIAGWRRELREGEMCLYDNQSVTWVASLSCGNFITDKLPVFAAMQEARIGSEPPAANSQGERSLEYNPHIIFDSPAAQTQAQEQAGAQSTRRPNWFSMKRNGKWFWPLVGGAVAVGVCTIPEPRCFTVTQKVNIHLN